eukprot:1469398-Prymnesium_polylepis.1
MPLHAQAADGGIASLLEARRLKTDRKGLLACPRLLRSTRPRHNPRATPAPIQTADKLKPSLSLDF